MPSRRNCWLEWWLTECPWWEFWRAGSGALGGAAASAFLILLFDLCRALAGSP